MEQQVFLRERATPVAAWLSAPENFPRFILSRTLRQAVSARSTRQLCSRKAPPKPAPSSSTLATSFRTAQHPLRADLVTVSACYSAGERAYSGEGLVGLAWAFLRAGAHNVIAGLWDVTDASTEQLMDRFYNELEKGISPGVALRTAKLSLLRGSQFNNPFY